MGYGVVSILTGSFGTLSTIKACLDPLFSERGNSWKLQCVLSSDWCPFHFFKGNVSNCKRVSVSFPKPCIFNLQPDPTSSLCLSSKNACAWSGCLLFSDEFRLQATSFTNCHEPRTIKWTKDMAKKKHVTCTKQIQQI